MSIHQRKMIFLGLTLGILCAAWLLVLRPREKNIKTLRAQIQEKQRLLEEMKTARPRAMENLREDIRELQAVVARQQDRLPQGEKIEKIFRDLSDLAAAHRLRIHQIRTNPAPAARLAADVPVTDIEEQGFLLELEGEFRSVQAFLEQLEKQPRLLRLDELRLQRIVQKSGPSTVQANLRLRVFSRKGPQTS